jgi:hypothetical protein
MTEDRRQMTDDRRQMTENRKFFIGLKASIPCVQTIYHRLYDNLHFVALTAASIQLKKPSVARRAYRSPMPWEGGQECGFILN